jgi:hypothetical protein
MEPPSDFNFLFTTLLVGKALRCDAGGPPALDRRLHIAAATDFEDEEGLDILDILTT